MRFQILDISEYGGASLMFERTGVTSRRTGKTKLASATLSDTL